MPVSVGSDRLFLLPDLQNRERIAVALSGGGDSLALLLMAEAYLARRGGATRLLALTVDHRLRPGSDREAAEMARFCAGRGIAHRTLAWEGAKPATGLSAAARLARHELLCRAAIEGGCDMVLTGHTFDDQAETVAMRTARGGGRGEAGIAPATLVDGRVWFVRPVLGTRRAALRAFLRAHGVAWIDDPTNVDTHYERARLRQALGEGEKQAAVDRAAAAAAARMEIGGRAAALVTAHADRPVPGLIRLGRGFPAGDMDAAIYALRILLAVAGGRDQLADAGRAEALVRRLSQEENFRATLSRAVVDARRDAVYLHREARALPSLPLGRRPVDWDGRYRLARAGIGDDGTCRAEPAGREASRSAGLPRGVAAGPARAALAAEPAIRLLSAEGDGEPRPLAGGPAGAVAGMSCVPLVGPWARFLPSFDLAAAGAVAALVGAVPPPFAGHIIRIDRH